MRECLGEFDLLGSSFYNEWPWRITMHKTIEAVYEKGAIKPLEPLELSELQKITVTIDTIESRVTSSKALIKTDADVVRQVAESDDYLYDAHTPPCR